MYRDLEDMCPPELLKSMTELLTSSSRSSIQLGKVVFFVAGGCTKPLFGNTAPYLRHIFNGSYNKFRQNYVSIFHLTHVPKMESESPCPVSKNWKKHPSPNFLCKLEYTILYSVYRCVPLYSTCVAVCKDNRLRGVISMRRRLAPPLGMVGSIAAPSSRLRRRRHESPMIPSRIIFERERERRYVTPTAALSSSLSPLAVAEAPRATFHPLSSLDHPIHPQSTHRGNRRESSFLLSNSPPPRPPLGDEERSDRGKAVVRYCERKKGVREKCICMPSGEGRACSRG